MQKTVENAVKNARPQATFSNLQLHNGQPALEALLVSAKPRRVDAVYAVETLRGLESESDDKVDSAAVEKSKKINEF